MDQEKPIIDEIKGVVTAYQPTEQKFKKPQFNLKDKGYDLRDVLGSGGYGKVYQGIHTLSRKDLQ